MPEWLRIILYISVPQGLSIILYISVPDWPSITLYIACQNGSVLNCAESCKDPLLLEYQSDIEEATGLQVEDAVLLPAKGVLPNLWSLTDQDLLK